MESGGDDVEVARRERIHVSAHMGLALAENREEGIRPFEHFAERRGLLDDQSVNTKRVLSEMGFIGTDEEMAGVRKTLDAAAWTYVAAFITSLAYFLYHLLPLLLGGRRDE